MDEDQKLTVMPESELDRFAAEFDDEDIEAIADLWQKYAGKRYKNLIITQEDDDAQPN